MSERIDKIWHRVDYSMDSGKTQMLFIRENARFRGIKNKYACLKTG